MAYAAGHEHVSRATATSASMMEQYVCLLVDYVFEQNVFRSGNLPFGHHGNIHFELGHADIGNQPAKASVNTHKNRDVCSALLLQGRISNHA